MGRVISSILGVLLVYTCIAGPKDNQGNLNASAAVKEKGMVKLQGIRYQPIWATHIACVKSCIDYLKITKSTAWVYGATGHAFLINFGDKNTCPSHPTAWDHTAFYTIEKNMGYATESIRGHRDDKDFAKKQEKAWAACKQAIDSGYPCYGWALDVSEYYVIYGYDDTGYYYMGVRADNGAGPKPWQEFGKKEFLELSIIRPAKTQDDKKALKDALLYALETNDHPEKAWDSAGGRKTGLAGFANWIKVMENGEIWGMGIAYNAAVWAECRQSAVGFLRESRKEIDPKMYASYDQLISDYDSVAQNLNAIASKVYPFDFANWGNMDVNAKDPNRKSNAIQLLKTARKFEASAIGRIRELVKRI